MEERRLCESDYRFMNVLWEHEPVSSGELVKLCAGALGWKKSTTYTTLKKLIEKGYAENVDTIVRARVPRDAVQAFESAHVVERTFGGSLPGFLAAFLGGRTISEAEAAELKGLIDAHRAEQEE